MAKINSTTQNTFYHDPVCNPFCSSHCLPSIHYSSTTCGSVFLGGRPFCFLILRGGEPLILAPGHQQAQGQHQNRIKWALPFPVRFILKSLTRRDSGPRSNPGQCPDSRPDNSCCRHSSMSDPHIPGGRLRRAKPPELCQSPRRR